MAAARTHVVLPAHLIGEIDALVGKRKRSQFLAEAAAAELQRLRQLRALEAAKGAWRAADHPELRRGAAAWVRQLRQQSDRRLPPSR